MVKIQNQDQEGFQQPFVSVEESDYYEFPREEETSLFIQFALSSQRGGAAQMTDPRPPGLFGGRRAPSQAPTEAAPPGSFDS